MSRRYLAADFERYLDAVRTGAVPIWAAQADEMPPFHVIAKRVQSNRKFARDFRIAAQVSAAIRLAARRENRHVD